MRYICGVVHRSEVAEAFINILGQVRTEFFGPDVEKSPEYGRLACVRSFKRVKAMLDKDKQYIKWGGEANADDKYDVMAAVQYRLATIHRKSRRARRA
jgi:aldehyde dehydrogenase (NAD+)